MDRQRGREREREGALSLCLQLDVFPRCCITHKHNYLYDALACMYLQDASNSGVVVKKSNMHHPECLISSLAPSQVNYARCMARYIHGPKGNYVV